MKQKPSKGRVTLERALSKLGISSRNEAAALIKSGLVKVHGVIETDPLRPVNPQTAHIELAGEKVLKSKVQLFAFHKPRAVITTKKDPEGRTTIFDLLPVALQSFHAVGRLDMHTSGLLLLTNETRISHYLTDPANKIKREYQVKVRGKIDEGAVTKMMEGVLDKDELLIAQGVSILKASSRESHLALILEEGKNREIRRLCLSLGHEVLSLMRVAYGPISLGQLKPGEWIETHLEILDLPFKGL